MKNIMKRAFSFALVTLLSGGLLTSCDQLSDILSGLQSQTQPSSSEKVSSPNGEKGSSEGGYNSDLEDINLDKVNDYLANAPEWEDMSTQGNKVSVIPFSHINGPKMESEFYAIVTFEYDARFYYKYQVTYLSCTCRSAEVNLWQTAYVELTVPSSGNIDDVRLRTLSFDNDSTEQYIGGNWGDSGVNGYDINDTGITYEDIKTGFIPFLVGKSYKQLSSYDNANFDGITYDDTVWGINKDDFISDMDGVKFHDDHQVTLDDFNGASVSTNNMLRVILALMEYHAANNI